MSLLTGIVGVANVISGVSTVLQQLNQQPRTQPNNAPFLDLLQQTMAADQAQNAEKTALETSKRFISFRDTNGDNRLSLAESGFSRELFDVLDKDGDGLLCEKELMPLFMQPQK